MSQKFLFSLGKDHWLEKEVVFRRERPLKWSKTGGGFGARIAFFLVSASVSSVSVLILETERLMTAVDGDFKKSGHGRRTVTPPDSSFPWSPIYTKTDTYKQCGEDPLDASDCRSLSAKEPPILGLFCGKIPIKIRHPTPCCHPVATFPCTLVSQICTCIHESKWLPWVFTGRPNYRAAKTLRAS